MEALMQTSPAIEKVLSPEPSRPMRPGQDELDNRLHIAVVFTSAGETLGVGRELVVMSVDNLI